VSLVARLLEWLLAPLLFLWIATAFVTFGSLYKVLNEAADRRVLEAAVHVHLLWKSSNQAPLAVSPLLASIGGSGGRRYEIGIYDRFGGEIVATSPGRIELGTAMQHGMMETLIVGDESSRCGVSKQDGNTVVVCDASSERTNQNLAVFRHILIPQSLILLLALALVWYGLNYILRPLARLRSDLDLRGVNDLRAINVNTAPHELEPLLISVNNLIARLSAGFESQRRFIANAAHQLRTPLSVIHSRIELAHRLLQSGDPKPAQEILSDQLKLSTRTTRLANQLLTLARSEAAPPERFTARVDVARALANVLGRSALRAEEKWVGLTYETLGPPTKWDVLGDATLIEEAISNVVENAISLAPPNTEVRCVVDPLAGALHIIDAGPGVSAEEAESLFHPFVRGATATHLGSGLGLAIVREIMQQHGGNAHFAQPGAQPGACVVLTFPIQSA
jgi:two-component system, OmpR family, sensor histidine kinase TctE